MEDRWGWVAAVAALMAPVGAALGNWWSRKGAKEQREGEWREKGNQNLFAQQGTQLQAAYGRIADLEAEVRRIEADRDRGWDLGRAAWDAARDFRHGHINLIHSIHARRELGRGLEGWDVPEPPKLLPLNQMLPEPEKPPP